MLTPEQIAALSRLHNYGTSYEIEAVTPDGRRGLVCYTERHSKRGMRDAMHDRAVPLLAWLGAPSGLEMTVERGRADIALSDGSVVRFSGRTQRDAIMSGELPFIGAAE